MGGRGSSIFDRHWKAVVGGTAISGIAVVIALFQFHGGPVGDQVGPPEVTREPAVAQTTETQVSDGIGPDASVTRDAAEPLPDAEPSAQTAPVQAFPDYSVERQEGFFRNYDRECYNAFGNTPQEMAGQVEEKVGKRISGFGRFDGGIIVNFRDGDRVAVWPKLIDCKDPPYNPLHRETDATQ